MSDQDLVQQYLNGGGRIKQVAQGRGLNLSGKAWKALTQGEKPPAYVAQRIERARQNNGRV